MSAPLVTIITPTHDRPAMFSECAAAVLAQTFTDWVWWVVFNVSESDVFRWEGPLPHAYDWRVFDDSRIVPVYYPLVDNFMRKSIHVPARIVNWLYPKVTTPYVYFLADDDLIDPDGLGVLVEAIENTSSPLGEPDTSGSLCVKPHLFPCQAVYGRCEVTDQQPDGSFTHACWCYEDGDVGGDTGISPHCLLDGGQVLHTADLWRRATADGWQLTDSKDAAANDGVLLSRLAEFARFHYVPQRIVTHRRHAGAAHHKPQVKL